MKTRIEALLQAAFAPVALEVIDESYQHAGHAGARPGGQTHYRVRIVSEALAGKSRVERHRRVYECLKPRLESGVHALAIEASGLTPG